MNIRFSQLTEQHLPLLLNWLEAPHVKAWWDQEINYNIDLVKKNFGIHCHGLSISSISNKLTYAYIVYLNDVPIGYIQAYNAQSFAEENALDESKIPTLSAGADIFIGEEAFLGQGLGAKILEVFCDTILSPYFDYCLVDPDSNNFRAIHLNSPLVLYTRICSFQ